MRFNETHLPTRFANGNEKQRVNKLKNDIRNEKFFNQIDDIILVPRTLGKETTQHDKCRHMECVNPHIQCINLFMITDKRLN